MQQVSKLTAVSIGHVAANKALNSSVIEIAPIEAMPMQSGELADNTTEYKTKATDSDGAAYETSTQMKASIKAEWLPIGNANRMTPPDVRRGELVVVYQFGDSDKYYWNTLKNDLAFRKLETVVYAFSATTDEGAKPNHDNCYFIEISTHKGSISIHTTKANGEAFSYDIVLNTKEGSFSITDDIGNQFLLDSAESRFLLKNDKGSCIDLNKLVLTMQVSDQISMETKNYSVKADTTTVEGTFSQNGGDGAKFGGTVHAIGQITGEAVIHASTVTANEIHGSHVTSDSAITAPNV